MPSENSSNGKSNTSISNIIIHNSLGLKLSDGPPNYENSTSFDKVEGKVKFITCSQNGNRLAWIVNGVVCVVEAPQWKRIGTLDHPKAAEVCFSPNGNFLAVWDIYSQAQGASPPQNLSIYDVTGRKLLKSFVQKSHEGWQPQWTKDEAIMARMAPSEVYLFEGKDLDNFKQKKSIQKLRSYSLSPSIRQHYVTFFVPSVKGAPAYVQLYKYPHLKDNSSVIASKSFFKVETVETFWNQTCTAVLLLTTAEVDKSGASYYGEQMLFFLSTRGDSVRVTFSKQGNIRSVAWCPSGREFFCVYGLAPARATIFNFKCDPISEFGEGARNIVLVNPQGNLVLLGGMGNISSRFEIWDVKEVKQISKLEYPDITHMEWSPCGQYILTSTCSPRLRVNNGYKVWHYSTSLLHENMCSGSEELYCSSWLPNSSLVVPFDISSKPVKGIQAEVKKASTQRYIPPSQRLAATNFGATVDTTKKFLSQRDDPAKEEDPKDAQKEKKKQKLKMKREEAKKKKEEEKGMDKDWREGKKEVEEVISKEKKQNVPKRKKNIKKKLEAIEKLKEEKDSGKFLLENQLEKINSEQALLDELQELESISLS